MKNENKKWQRTEGKVLGTKVIQYIYRGSKLVWTAISSCFGSGVWLNDKVWNNNDSWKN